MRLETRLRRNAAGSVERQDVLFIATNERESLILDGAFGSDADNPDSIFEGERRIQVRLADGYAEHYVVIELPVVDASAEINLVEAVEAVEGAEERVETALAELSRAYYEAPEDIDAAARELAEAEAALREVQAQE